MKSKAKIVILLTLVIFFTFSNISKNFITNQQSLEFNEKDQGQINQSGFWDLTGSPIFIDDTDPNYNWSKTALNYAWCSGSGSWADPYVIEHVTINGQGSEFCIKIEDSDVYFIIQNCSLYNSGPFPVLSGIYLFNVDNGKIISTNCSDNYKGIYLSESNNNTLSGNTANNNGFGIDLGDSDNNLLSGNIVSSNSFGIDLWGSDNNKLLGNNANNNDYGISLRESNNNNLSGNTVSNNNLHGISLDYSNNNNLSENIMNFCGISLSGSFAEVASHIIDDTNLVNNKPVYYYVNELGLGLSNFTNAGQIFLINCNNSIISGFNLSNSTTGIYLGYSNNNILSGNNASNNNLYGIYLCYSNNNTLSGNNACNNSDGISLEYSNNNNLSGNTACNNSDGIDLIFSNNNNLTGNTANNYYRGISLRNSDNNTLLGNTASNNTLHGISLEYSNYHNLSGNIMNFCGIYLSGSLAEVASHSIDDTNLVNNKPVYYYVNELGLGSNNFTCAGQIFLVNCNDSLILDLEFSYCSSGISLWNCFNNTIFNNTAFNLYYHGISISNCNNISITQNNVSNCFIDGIKIDNANHINLSKNSVDYCMQGINTLDCNNTFISNNIMINNTGALVFSSYGKKIENITITGNIMNGSGLMLNVGDIKKTTFNIDQSNLVNGKILYYYINENSLTHNNFTNAGQIYIYNCSDVSFSDLDLSRSTLGLMVYNCNNLTISNIDSSYNSLAAIMIYNCNNSKFSELTIKNCTTYGLYLVFSHDIIISNNTITDSDYAFFLYNCLNITLVGNYFDNNMESIRMDSCSYSTLINNTINNNKMETFFGGDALLLYYSSHNNIIGNKLLNSENIGIHIGGNSNNNTFLRNIIANNSQYGVFFGSSGNNNNTFYLNNFLNNGINVEDNGVDNRWYDGFAGNYWDDYSGVDLNPIDGIGDSSFLVNGTAGVFDTKPLMYPTYEDTDGEGLINYEEYVLGDDNYRTNVTNSDSDYDGLSDYWEWRNSTNPWESDTDFDNMPDLWEVTNSLNANFNDAMVDTDLDLLLNLYEYHNGTDPQNPDSDFDNMPDGWEVFNSLDPLSDDAFNDTDTDFLLNIYEYLNGTDPHNNDTDLDNMPDGWEVFNLFNPLSGLDNLTDADSDLLLNLYEYLEGTDPHNDDTDGDTFLDGNEADPSNQWWTDPLDKWWYPMPNLEILDFKAKAVEIGKPFTLNFTITNNGIWRAENVIIIIWIELLNETIYTNIGSPIDLEVDQIYQDLIQITTGVTASGGLVMELILDPLNLINETYSSKDGSLRADGEDNNSKETELQITGDLPPDPFWLIVIILAIVAISTGISLFIIFRPKLRRRTAAKRLIKSAKDDIRNFEINIRSFIKSKLKDNFKSIWWEEGIPEYIKQVVDNKINAIQPKKLDATLDKIDFLDFTHFNAIITDTKNWEPIFSDIFTDKTIVETNLESLRVFKRNLYDGKVTPEEMSNYTFFIYTISSYFAKGFNIFLSYSTLDTDYFRIKEIAKRLESYPRINKVLFWEEDSQENIVVYMEKTLQMSKVFVFFCSQKAIKSKAVADEWQAAFQMRKKGLIKIIPVYEKEELIPNLLMPLLNVKYTKDDFEGFIEKLYEEILR